MTYTAHTFTLPEIKGISTEQMKVHLDLYRGYVTHVNLLMEQMNKLAQSGNEYTYTISEIRRRLGFEWNGMHLHELFFEGLEGGAKVLLGDTALYEALSKQYGSFSNWIDIYTKFSARGPGWALLTYDKNAKHFHHVWASDHEVGQLASLPIIIAVDHWEHAYMVDYTPSDKNLYIEAYIKALNWETIRKRFDEALK